MRRTLLFLLAILVLPLAEAGAQATFNDVSRFVAGLPVAPGSPLAQIEGLPAVRKHRHLAVDLSKTWHERRLNAIRDWAKAEIHPKIARPEVVKYPFGGPDFVHAATLFPGANEYVLVGLEPLGSLPDFLAMSDPQLDAYLSQLGHSLRSISQRNFFITTEMREDFGKQGVDGVYPVLLFFATLTKHDVINGQFVRLDESGNAIVADPASAQGIRLEIRATDRLPDFPASAFIYYFKSDLSDSGFKPDSPMKKFFDQRPGQICYLKAASYLMHQAAFTNVRNYLVGNCQWILQDESGIPAEFLATYFDVTYYGNYVGPIDMFREFDQPYLRQVYGAGVARPLPFGTGYRMKDGDSIQMFGVRK